MAMISVKAEVVLPHDVKMSEQVSKLKHYIEGAAPHLRVSCGDWHEDNNSSSITLWLCGEVKGVMHLLGSLELAFIELTVQVADTVYGWLKYSEIPEQDGWQRPHYA